MSKQEKMAPFGYYVQVFKYHDGSEHIPVDIIRILPDERLGVRASYCRDDSDVWAALLWSCAPRRNYSKIVDYGSFTAEYRKLETLEEAVALTGQQNALTAVPNYK